MKQAKLLALALLALLTVVIVLQNTGPVETKILFATLTMPAALLLFVAAALGFVLGVGTSYLFLRGRAPRRESGTP